MDKNYLSVNRNLLFSVTIRAFFLKGGKYKIENRSFNNFLGKTQKSLYDYMISNKSNLRNFVKSKRNGNNKLFIRKNDDFDFLREDLFSITNIKNATPKFFSIVSLSSSNIFFTDIGIMTLREWVSRNEELFI